MKRSGSILSLAIAVVPIVYLLLFRDRVVNLPESVTRIITALPFGIGFVFILLSVRIRRLIDTLPALVYLAIYLSVMTVKGARIPVPPEIIFPAIVLLTQIAAAVSFRRYLEVACFVLTGFAILAILLPPLFPDLIPVLTLQEEFSRIGIQTAWVMSDIGAVLFLITAGILTIMPRNRPLSLRFEYILVLVSAFLMMDREAAGGATAGPLFPAICSTAIMLILITGIVRIFLRNALVDELTGLQNRRALDERLKRLSGAFALSLVDIDHFKVVNDTHGHAEGDNALRWTAKHLIDSAGKRAYRYGGEEFCVVFPARIADRARDEMERFRRSLADGHFYLRKIPRTKKQKKLKKKRGSNEAKKRVKVTVSIGIAARGPRHKTAEKVLKAADEALYRAKDGGRNRTTVADS